jgi:DNA integrity scanning protein DisA with diadenylate cyclase activity
MNDEFSGESSPKINTPCVDFSFQFNTAKEQAKVEEKIFKLLCSISDKNAISGNYIGTICVVGSFDNYKNNLVPGMRQIGKNRVDTYLNVINDECESDIAERISKGHDGAIIINKNGQILGIGIYLIVEHPTLEVPEGSGARHIAAASFSMREDVQIVYIISEESNVVRSWKNGILVEQYAPKLDNAGVTNDKK